MSKEEMLKAMSLMSLLSAGFTDREKEIFSMGVKFANLAAGLKSEIAPLVQETIKEVKNA